MIHQRRVLAAGGPSNGHPIRRTMAIAICDTASTLRKPDWPPPATRLVCFRDSPGFTRLVPSKGTSPKRIPVNSEMATVNTSILASTAIPADLGYLNASAKIDTEDHHAE